MNKILVSYKLEHVMIKAMKQLATELNITVTQLIEHSIKCTLSRPMDEVANEINQSIIKLPQ